MAGVSASHLIMFVGSLVVASAVAGTVVMEVGQVSNTIEVRGGAVADDIETDLAIISDESQPDAIVDDGEEEGEDEVSVLVKNIGNSEVPADPNAFDVLVDGSYASVDTVEKLPEDADHWEPGSVVEVTVTEQSIDGDTEVVVMVSGNEDSIRFHYDAEEGGE